MRSASRTVASPRRMPMSPTRTSAGRASVGSRDGWAAYIASTLGTSMAQPDAVAAATDAIGAPDDTRTALVVLSDGGDTNLWVDVLDPLFNDQNLSEIFDFRGAVFVDLASPSPGYRIDPPYAP